MNRVGIYSGTFDPVHVGHIEFALQAINMCQLAKTILLPEPQPREKSDVCAISHRLNMLRMASRPYPKLEVIALDSKQFTVQETLPLLQARQPNDQLVYLCGSDVAKTFLYRWPGLSTLLKTTEIVVGLRNEDSEEEIRMIFNELLYSEGVAAKYTVLKAPAHLLASTMLRNDMHTINDVDPAVAAYITKNNLYS
ncbi:hypothetical protein EB118_08510 [bacterium]|nr:hypothetical protein [bacterium]NDC94606.1 hypothetical protein [bacterium]NDD84491.1 hypothetical protein [bacterium]NDG30105.1 hypothetical protein [bacterium]